METYSLETIETKRKRKHKLEILEKLMSDMEEVFEYEIPIEKKILLLQALYEESKRKLNNV